MWSRCLRNIIVVSLFAPSVVSAASFSEIMYDVSGNDSGREWIEIYNDGTEPLDLSQARLVEAGVRHKVTAVRGAIPGMGYGVIAANPEKFLVDWPSYAGPLFDSAFSLSNSGETLSLESPSTTPVRVSYVGIDSNGNTLNNVSGSWVLRAPSPGLEAQTEAIVVKKDTPKSAQKVGNVSLVASVRGGTEGTPEPPVSREEAPSDGFGIIPWIVGLCALVAVGIGAIFLTGTKRKSGYTITEDIS